MDKTAQESRVWLFVYLVPIRVVPSAAYWVIGGLQCVWALMYLFNANLMQSAVVFITNLIICLAFFFVKLLGMIKRTRKWERLVMVVTIAWCVFSWLLLIYAIIQTAASSTTLAAAINYAQGTTLTPADVSKFFTGVYVAAGFLIYVTSVHLWWVFTFWQCVKAREIKSQKSEENQLKITE